MPCGQRACHLLPVGALCRRHLREQHLQRLAQGRLVKRDDLIEALLDRLAHRLLVLPVAAQVQARAAQHQRRVAVAVAHQARMMQGPLPGGQVHADQQRSRRPGRGSRAQVCGNWWFRRQ